MTFNIKACDVSEEEGILLMLISSVEKTTAVLLLVKTSPVDSQNNPGPTFSHLVCIITQLGNSSVLSLNLYGCSAMGAVGLAVSACRLSGAFPGLGLVALASGPSELGTLCGVTVCRGLPLDRLIPTIVASAHQCTPVALVQTKPFFLGKSYGLLKVINID